MTTGECFKTNVLVEQLLGDAQQTRRLFAHFVSFIEKKN